MNGQQNPVELLVISVVMVVLGMIGVMAGFSRDLRGGLDGLLLLFVSLMIALIFAILLFVLARDQGWIGKRSKDAGGPQTSPAAGK